MRGGRTVEGEAATQVILSIFRANGVILAAGDRLAAAEGLTSARWQVLGAIAVAEHPLTIPQIARRMGVTRQSVHATVNRLAADGLLERLPNIDHRRSPVIDLTGAGRAAYTAIDERQIRWVNRLARRMPRGDLQTASRVLDELSRRLLPDAKASGEDPALPAGAAR
jgi:DNA-binding MarR family transcriptional regulator